MANRKSLWLIVIAVLILAAFIVPFTLLSDVDAWYGSFLFWVVVSVFVISINAFVSASWRDKE